jgi:hypothetical protein
MDRRNGCQQQCNRDCAQRSGAHDGQRQQSDKKKIIMKKKIIKREIGATERQKRKSNVRDWRCCKITRDVQRHTDSRALTVRSWHTREKKRKEKKNGKK